jgi:hypothetical protein
MKIKQKKQYTKALELSEILIDILEKLTENTRLKDSDLVTLNFRDPDYSANSGGYHPVEICINGAGQILFITDFSYVGSGDMVELAKELDFDFSQRVFEQFGIMHEIEEGEELFQIWQENFCCYYQSEIFKVEVSKI